MLTDLRKPAAGAQFRPGLLGLFINPFYLARRALWNEISSLAKQVHSEDARVIDIGCGRKPYRSIFKTDSYIGLEIDSEFARARGHADAFYDGKRFPFPDQYFDVALCNQVLEHVFNPLEFLAEIRRVLKPGGKLLLTVPFVWDEHEQPYDFARYSSFGLSHLLQESGFRVLVYRKTLNDASVLAQLFNAYLFKCTRTRAAAVNLLLTAFLMAPVSIVGFLLGKLLPANNDLFLDSVVLTEKI